MWAAGSTSIMISVSLSGRQSPRAREPNKATWVTPPLAQGGFVLAQPLKDILPVHGAVCTTKSKLGQFQNGPARSDERCSFGVIVGDIIAMLLPVKTIILMPSAAQDLDALPEMHARQWKPGWLVTRSPAREM
jgi:hypothetical protein